MTFDQMVDAAEQALNSAYDGSLLDAERATYAAIACAQALLAIASTMRSGDQPKADGPKGN